MDLKFWKRKDIEIKSTTGGNPAASNQSFVAFLQDNDKWQLSFSTLIQYAKRCAPFSNSAAIIAESCASVPFGVWDKRSDQFIENHPSLELLEYPNNEWSKKDLIRQAVTMICITGNPYIQLVGNVRRPPVSIDIIGPQLAQIDADSFGDIKDITVRNDFGSKKYIAGFDKGRRRLRSSNDNEIWPMFSVNMDRGTRTFYGTAKAQPLYYSIEQYIQAGLHNKSILSRGARPGGLFTIDQDGDMTPDQRQDLKNHVDMYFAGASNSGRSLVGQNIKYQDLSTSNKDMDYKSVISNATVDIYNQFAIPLPIVAQDSQKYSNYESAQIALYDRATLPMMDYFLEQLTQAMMYRYEQDWKRYEFKYDESKISVLAPRKMTTAKSQATVGVSTVNELREVIGLPPVQGGDDIYRPSNEIPILDGADEPPPQPTDIPNE